MRRATQCARPWNVQGLRIGQGVPLVLADWDLRDRAYNTVIRYVRLDFFPAFKPDIHDARQSLNRETSIVGYNILHDLHVQQGAIQIIIRHSLITIHCLSLFPQLSQLCAYPFNHFLLHRSRTVHYPILFFFHPYFAATAFRTLLLFFVILLSSVTSLTSTLSFGSR